MSVNSNWRTDGRGGPRICGGGWPEEYFTPAADAVGKLHIDVLTEVLERAQAVVVLLDYVLADGRLVLNVPGETVLAGLRSVDGDLERALTILRQADDTGGQHGGR